MEHFLKINMKSSDESVVAAAPEDGGGGGAEVAPPDGRLYDRQVFPPGEDQGEFQGQSFPQ
jgi:hypothetical protein